jgi:thiol-disulfide isomerase/thioredoxin
MTIWMRHPGEQEIAAFADRLPTPARIVRHLEHCERCRRDVAGRRELIASARELSAPKLDRGPLVRALARLDEGERLLLPTEPSVTKTQNAWRFVAAAAIALGALGTGLYFAGGMRELRAGTNVGDLQMTPAYPRRAATIDLVYRAATVLEKSPELVVRAEFYMLDGSRPSARRVAVLHPSRSNIFRGTLVLPDSAAYAVLAVEDSAARYVDTNNGKFWGIMTHDEANRPTLPAFDGVVTAFVTRDQDSTLRAARRATELYADSLQAWHLLGFAEANALGEENVDTARMRKQLSQFGDSLRNRPDVPASAMTTLWFWSSRLEDSLRANYWMRRLAADHPRSRNGISVRSSLLWHLMKDDPAAGRKAVRKFWEEMRAECARGLKDGTYETTTSQLDSLRDQELIGFVSRIALRCGIDTMDVARNMLRSPSLQDEALDVLRAKVRAMTNEVDAYRDLGETRAEAERALQSRRKFAYAALGEALIGTGAVNAGLDTLELAVRDMWNLRLFRRVAAIRLSATDTAGALQLLAKVAADPGTPRKFVDSVRARLNVAGAREAEWRVLLNQAGTELHSTMLSRAVTRALPIDPRMRQMDGREVPLSSVTKNKLTLIVFWGTKCGPCIQEQPELVALKELLARDSIQLVTVPEDTRTDVETFLRKRKMSLPVLLDGRREASKAFKLPWIPHHVLVDGKQRIRFEHIRLDEVLAAAAAIRWSDSKGKGLASH